MPLSKYSETHDRWRQPPDVLARRAKTHAAKCAISKTPPTNLPNRKRSAYICDDGSSFHCVVDARTLESLKCLRIRATFKIFNMRVMLAAPPRSTLDLNSSRRCIHGMDASKYTAAQDSRYATAI